VLQLHFSDHRRNLRGYEGYRSPLLRPEKWGYGTTQSKMGVGSTGTPRTPFLDWVVPYPHFSGRKTKGEEFAVTCCQQMRSARLNYNEPFSAKAPPQTLLRCSRRSPWCQNLVGKGYFLPILLPSHIGTPRAPRFSSELVPTLFRPKLLKCW